MSTTLDASMGEAPARDTDPGVAGYVMSLPDRHLGYWDNTHLRAVTGYDWAHWGAIFEAAQGFEGVFRSMSTKTYLVESGRYHAIQERAAVVESARSGE